LGTVVVATHRARSFERNPGELCVKRRRQDLVGQVTEHREKLHEDETEGFAEIRVLRTLGAESLERNAFARDGQRREEGKPLRRQIEDAIDDGAERNLTERDLGAPPESAEGVREEGDELRRRQALGGPLQPGIDVPGVVGFVGKSFG
jgi:hypothetical protein